MFLSLALNDMNKIVHEDIDSYMYAYHVQFNHFILKVVIYHKKTLYLKDMFKSIFWMHRFNNVDPYNIYVRDLVRVSCI